MPYIREVEKPHKCLRPTGRRAHTGSVWECPECEKLWVIVDHDGKHATWYQTKIPKPIALVNEDVWDSWFKKVYAEWIECAIEKEQTMDKYEEGT